MHLRGDAWVETSDALFKADEIDYNRETKVLEARGHAYYKSYEKGEEIYCDRLDYDTKAKQGTFWNVHGTIPAKNQTRPGVMGTNNPESFRGRYAERKGDHYWLYDGMMTNCDPKNPSWELISPRFDIIPHDRALAYWTYMKLLKLPILYVPVFYRSLEERPRHSGFLTPSIGNSSVRGQMFGLGYYWAISRSLDLQYRVQYFTKRGFAHHAEFRGKPTSNTEFDALVYGVADRLNEGGFLFTFNGKADLGDGWTARGTANYLSSFVFRQNFTESFNEAVFSEVNSVGFLTKSWDTITFNAVASRHQNFMDAVGNSSIVIRKLPQFEFDSRDHEVKKDWPIWVSWDASAGLVRRTQDLYQTRQFVPRLDAEPRITTALRWKDLSLIPSFSVRETDYGASFVNGKISGDNVLRSSREFDADLILPALERIFPAPKWMGSQVKHTIETRASFKHVDGVTDFGRLVRFDEMELEANTNELEVMVANRLWAKRKDGQVLDVLSWELSQRRFFSPTFGGALVDGVRNVFLASEEMTAYTFFDQPRRESPYVSSIRLSPMPGIGLDWRADYDTLRGKLVNNAVTFDARKDNYFFSFGHSYVSCIPLQQVPGSNGVLVTPCGLEQPPQGSVLSPPANQFRGMVGFGNENKRGWNGAFLVIYEARTGTVQYMNTQITYNTSCCAFSGQFRRLKFGTRDENQYRFAYVIANFGSFGTLRRQERLF